MENFAKYYHILDVDPGCSEEEIRKAYYAKAKLWHPDLNPSPQAHINFILIKEAYIKISSLARYRNSVNHSQNNTSRKKEYPYYSYPYRHVYTHKQHVQKSKDDFTDTREGKIIYIAVHVAFAFIGILVFIKPLILIITRRLDPERTLADSLVAITASMLFGMMMILLVSKSLFSFIKQYH